MRDDVLRFTVHASRFTFYVSHLPGWFQPVVIISCISSVDSPVIRDAAHFGVDCKTRRDRDKPPANPSGENGDFQFKSPVRSGRVSGIGTMPSLMNVAGPNYKDLKNTLNIFIFSIKYRNIHECML